MWLWVDAVFTAGLVALALGTAVLLFYGWQLNRRDARRAQAANRLRYALVLHVLERVRSALASRE